MRSPFEELPPIEKAPVTLILVGLAAIFALVLIGSLLARCMTGE